MVPSHSLCFDAKIYDQVITFIPVIISDQVQIVDQVIIFVNFCLFTATLQNEVTCLQNLLNDSSDPKLRKWIFPFSHESEKVCLDVLEDEVESAVLPDHLLQLDNVRVVQLLQGLYLTQVHHLK